MEQGWIKLHRKLLDNPICKKPTYAWLWVYLLLKANHKPKEFMWNGKVIIIKDGQLLTGRKELSKETGIPETTIERALEYFEKNGHQIEQQKTTKFRVINILNWHTYQKEDTKTDNKRTTNGQQTDTNKNEKNEKNEKKDIATEVAPSIFSLKEEIKKLEENSRRDLNIIAFYLEQRMPDIKSPAQLQVAIRRHLRAAKELKVFSDDQIINAAKKAKADFKDIDWTLETLGKILCK